MTRIQKQPAPAPTRARREREKRERRAAILEAARTLFWTRGYARTTMPDVARAAELAPGTLYLYFASKDALYAELLVEGYERLLERLRAAVDRAGTPRRRADALVGAFLGFAREFPQYFDVIFFVRQRGDDPGAEPLDPAQAARIGALEDACKALAVPLVASAARRTAARRARPVVDTVWAMLVGLVGWWGRDPQFDTLAGIARRAIVDALFPASGSGGRP